MIHNAPMSVVAFDMKDPAQRQMLHDLLQPTELQKAEREVSNSAAMVDEFIRKHLTPEQRIKFALFRDVPTDMQPELAADLTERMARQSRAVTALKTIKGK